MPTFLDLFSGAGGLSLGMSQAGWRPLLAIDNWSDAIATYRRYFSDHPALDIDIAEVDVPLLTRHLDERPDWIVGGPPCQGFSTVGKRQRTDPRNKLVEHFRRIVKELEPEGFVVENVLGLKDMGAHRAIAELFEAIGYHVSFNVVTAADFGVPQLRRRVVFVGHRDRGHFQLPVPKLSPAEYVTVDQAIGDLPEVGPGETADRYTRRAFTSYQREMRSGSTTLQGHTVSAHPPHLVNAISFIPDGGNRYDIPEPFQPASGFHNSYSRLASFKPAVAVTGNMGKPSATRCVHPFQDRGLTAREGARLQSFPDVFHFCAGVTSQRLQIANAVPPLLARALAMAIDDPAAWSGETTHRLALAAAA